MKARLRARRAGVAALLLHGLVAAAQGGGDAFGQLLVLDDRVIEGQGNAPLTLVEFIDYRSPWTRGAAAQTVADIRRLYVGTGQLKLGIMQLPVSPGSERSAQAAACAARQGQFWPFHRALVAASGDVGKALERSPGLDAQALDRCLNAADVSGAVSAQKAQALQLGVPGAPSFVLAAPDPGAPGRLKVVQILPGARLQPVRQAIERALAEPPEFPPEPPPTPAPQVLTVHAVTLEPEVVAGGQSLALSWEVSVSTAEPSPVEFYYEIESQGRTVFRSERRSLTVPPGEHVKKSIRVKTAPAPGQYSLITQVRWQEERYQVRKPFTVR